MAGGIKVINEPKADEGQKAAPTVIIPGSPSQGVSGLPPVDGNYVIYRGRYKSHVVRCPGRELAYSYPAPPMDPGESEKAYEIRKQAAGRTIMERTGQFMNDGGTVYVFGLEGDTTLRTKDGFPWVEVRLPQHIAYFEQQNLLAIRNDQEPLYEVVMTSEMKRDVLGILSRKSKEEQAREELFGMVLKGA